MKDLEEEYKIFEHAAYNEGIAELLKGAGAGVSNLVGQNLRGAGNILKGGWQTGTGIGKMGVGALQALGGGEEPARRNFRKGFKRAEKGIESGLTGAAQMVLSPVSAAVRGVQAAGEKGLSSMSPRRSTSQKIFGINAWDQQADVLDRKERARAARQAEKKEQKRQQLADMEAQIKETIAKHASEIVNAKKAGNAELVKALLKKTREEQPELFTKIHAEVLTMLGKYKEERFQQLAGQFEDAIKSGNSKAARNIQMHLKKNFPDKYEAAVRKKYLGS
jgi:hypothetical protein